MMLGCEEISPFLCGPLLAETREWPLVVRARLCELRPGFLPKGRVGGGYRAVARNGRVLLASDQPLAKLAGQVARVRFQPWRKSILPQDPPEPFGLLLCVRMEEGVFRGATFAAHLAPLADKSYDLGVEVGGRLLLGFWHTG